MRKIPIILFGDHIAAYGVIRALGPRHIPIYIVSQNGKGLCTHSRYVKKVLTLNASDADFINKLKNWISLNIGTEAVLMIAGDDQYLDILSQNHGSLEPNLKCTFPPWNITKKVRNKRETYKIAESIGIPVPQTYFIESENELKEILSNGLNIKYPLLMKSEESKKFLNKYGTKGVISNNEKELLENYSRYDGFMGELLLQEMVPGNEDKLFCLKTVLNRNSDPLAIFVDKKIRSSAQFLSCTLTASTWSEEVVEYGLKLLKNIGYIGYASVEFKLDDRDSTFKLMEINGRISMNNSYPLIAGINLPYLMYEEALHGSLLCLNDIRQKYYDRILWWYLDGEIGMVYRAIKDWNFNLIEYLRPLIGRKLIIEPLNIWDLKPFINSTPLNLMRLVRKR